MSQILVIDVGNSRMKWGLHGPRGWRALGVTPNADIGALSVRDWHNLPRPARVVGVNVAGEAARVRVEAQLARWRVTPEWLVATDAACGVTNRYARPAQLGADRWASLVAAWRRSTALDLFPPACVVVNAGTAVTDRRARQRRRLPRRTDPARDAAHAAGARREHGGPPGSARGIPRFPGQHRRRDLFGRRAGGLRGDRADAPARSTRIRRTCAATSPAAPPRSSGRTSTRRWKSWIISCSKACSRFPERLESRVGSGPRARPRRRRAIPPRARARTG